MAIRRTPEEERARLEEQLRLMMKKAETTTPEEAEMIQAKVEKLMIQLGIEDIMSMTEDKKNEDIVTDEFPFEGVYAPAWVRMAYAIVTALGNLEGIASDVYVNYKKKGMRLTIVGYQSDVKRARTLIESLCLQCLTAVSVHMKTVPNYCSASQKYNVKRSFIMGFGVGAGERIKVTRHNVVEETNDSTPGTALVLAERGTIVRQRYEEMFTSTRTMRSTKVVIGGYSEGKAAGRVARTGESEVSKNGQRAIG